MERTTVLLASVLTFALAATSVWAGTEVPPTGHQLLKGDLASEAPLEEMTNDDDDYYILSSVGSGTSVTSYVASFADIPPLDGTTQLRLRLAAKGSPTCAAKMWHWRKDRFVAIGGDPFAVASEAETLLTIDNPGRFVRRNKARTKITCTDDSGFGLGTDLLRFVP